MYSSQHETLQNYSYNVLIINSQMFKRHTMETELPSDVFWDDFIGSWEGGGCLWNTWPVIMKKPEMYYIVSFLFLACPISPTQRPRKPGFKIHQYTKENEVNWRFPSIFYKQHSQKDCNCSFKTDYDGESWIPCRRAFQELGPSLDWAHPLHYIHLYLDTWNLNLLCALRDPWGTCLFVTVGWGFIGPKASAYCSAVHVLPRQSMIYLNVLGSWGTFLQPGG